MASSTSFTEGGQGGGGDVNDPFYLVREEISDSVSTCESSFSRMHNLQTNQQQKKETCINISSEIDSLLWQLNELDRATEAAERDPNRFRVSREELKRRKAWTSNERAVERFKRTSGKRDDEQ